MKYVYAGSFDPPTIGHEWVIRQATKLADSGELVVAVGVNPAKKPMFSVWERVEMLKQLTRPFSHVSIDSFENAFLIDYAKKIRADFIVRGVRNAEDALAELAMHEFNRARNGVIHTVFVPTAREYSLVSSRFVKDLIGPQGWEEVISSYLSPLVWERVIQKVKDGKERSNG